MELPKHSCINCAYIYMLGEVRLALINRLEIFNKESLGIAKLGYLLCEQEKFYPYFLSKISKEEFYKRITKKNRCKKYKNYVLDKRLFLDVILKKNNNNMPETNDTE